MDIDPHEGTREYELYQWLKFNKYQGLLLCDDIWFFKPMRDNFWYLIPSAEKLDLTRFGHWSGTGLIRFPQCKYNVQLPTATRSEVYLPNMNPEWFMPLEKSYTFVTGYFDLTKYEDASPEIKARPDSFYLQSAHTTMSLDANLIVFCEPKYRPQLAALRPKHLRAKTMYVECEFEDFRLNKHRAQIDENRKTNPVADPRNTASYYLFCMARYAMVRQAILTNPFQSTHFAWINVCIERYGYKNIIALQDVIREYRDKFSTCYIDYIPRSMVANVPEYFKWGRCSLCSGFFTGRGDYFLEFIQEIETQFLGYLNSGYGHADEQLYSPIFFRRPEIFQVYWADYGSMITNYVKIVDDVRSVIVHLMENSNKHQDYSVCYPAGKAVWTYCHSGNNETCDVLGDLKYRYCWMFLTSL